MSKNVTSFFDLPSCITTEYYDSVPPFTVESNWQLCYRDLSDRDVRIESEAELSELCFNTETVFPNKLQAMAEQVIQSGKNNALNNSGLTGKGIKVAVIDRPINRDHVEFKNRLEYIEVFPDHPDNSFPDFHGMTCAGFLSGSSCGVAPGSELVYFAIPNKTDDPETYYEFQLEALQKVVEYNRNCNSPIRVVSLSAPFSKNQKDERNSLADQLLETGCVLIDAESFGRDFQGIDCFKKRDRIFFELNKWQVENYERNKERPGFADYFRSLCFVPSTRRTSPGNETNSEYIHWSKAISESWSIPHLAGSFMLCLEAEPNLRYDEFVRRCKTCPKHDGLTILDLKFVIHE